VRALAPGIAERNYAKEPLTESELLAIVAAAGGVGPVLNARHETAKALGWSAASPPAAEAFAAAAAREPNLLRRPILLAGGMVIVGRDEEGWRAALGG
jgi:arsenate reductase-like glutaredoxin family protein